MSEDRPIPGAGPRPEGAAADDEFARLREELRRRDEENRELRSTVLAQQRAMAAIEGSLVWQVASRFWNARDRLLARSSMARRAYLGASATLKGLVGARLPRLRNSPFDPGASYGDWVARNSPSRGELEEMRARAERAGSRCSFSLVVPLRAAEEPLLARSIASVRAQVWGCWEMLLVSEASAGGDARLPLAGSNEPRIRVEPVARGGLPPVRGEFVVFLEPGDELAPEALFEVASALEEDSGLDLVYSDEDAIDEAGVRSAPFFKPDWSPDLLLSLDFASRLGACRWSLLREVGGLHWGLGADAAYAATLCASERARRVGHVRKVLYHRRRRAPRGSSCGEAAPEGRAAALRDALARRGLDGTVEASGPEPRARLAVKGSPLVSIIMPTKDKAAVLRSCIESIERRTTWRRRELVVIDNGSTERAARRYLRSIADRHRVLGFDQPFNWSAVNNWGAARAGGEYLLFMNNDMEVIAPDWIEALLEHAQRPEIGAVGARLLYPDGTIQHAGIVLGMGSVAGHAFKDLPRDAPGHGGLAQAVRNVSAVTGACMMVRRDVFRELGGFDEGLRVAYNDVDFCLRVGAAGYRVVYTPFAVLYHHEGATRRALHPADDEALMKTRWHAALRGDPYFSPHLLPGGEGGGGRGASSGASGARRAETRTSRSPSPLP